MLKSTFLHIPNITQDTEKEIWSHQIFNWQELLININNLNLRNKEQVCSFVKESITAYDKKNISFFLNNLPSNEHWRVYKDFKCCFLDIETTGLSKHYHDVTVIGLYDGNNSKVFINGKNLDQFSKEINKYDVIVSFNGKCFDVPFLKAKFPEINFNKFHLDLRYVMKDLGFSRGLKKIEKEIGIQRDDDLQEVDGYEAVRLWKRYQKGDEEALKLLVKYNIADVENLKVMMDFAFDKLKAKIF